MPRNAVKPASEDRAATGKRARTRRLVLRAAVACIAADRAVTATEGELLRAISASLGCPMPPLLLT